MHEELVAVPWQELDGVEWFYVFITGFPIELSYFLASRSIVADQATIVLIAIQLKHIEGFPIRSPCNIGEIDGLCIGDGITDHAAVRGLQIDSLVGVNVVNANSHDVSIHTCHRIFVRLISGTTREDIHLRIVCHHRLVHAIEGQTLTIGAPESSFVNAKLIAVNTLTIDNLATSVSSQLVLLALGVSHKQLMTLNISSSPGGFVPIVGSLTRDAVLPDGLMGLEIDQDKCFSVA